MWLEIQINGSAAGVPDSVVVGGQDTKLVLAGRDIGVVSDPAGTGKSPVFIKALQLVFDGDLLGGHKA